MQKYIAIRYNPDLVMKVMDQPATLPLLLSNNPMEPDYALKASTLELMMWIRGYAIWAEPDKQRNHAGSTD
ncbi:MAG: hypothetical protein H6550_16495 [Chitinophagales bacterium]|nr:hypothetical protein [Chitinophagales bacterium]